jgi:hypothetical protein
LRWDTNDNSLQISFYQELLLVVVYLHSEQHSPIRGIRLHLIITASCYLICIDTPTELSFWKFVFHKGDRNLLHIVNKMRNKNISHCRNNSKYNRTFQNEANRNLQYIDTLYSFTFLDCCRKLIFIRWLPIFVVFFGVINSRNLVHHEMHI